MAKRRNNWSKGARIGYGLTEGVQPTLQALMQQWAAERASARSATLKEAADARTLDRQALLNEQEAGLKQRGDLINSVLPKIATGEVSPDQALSMFQTAGVDLFPTKHSRNFVGTGEYDREIAANEDKTKTLFGNMRPPLRRRLESTVGASIDKATTSEQLDPMTILSQARSADDRASAGVPGDPSWLSDNAFTNDPVGADTYTNPVAPDVMDLVQRAQAKSASLENAPGDRLTIENTDGSKSVIAPSKADLAAGPIQISPTSEQQGANEGVKDLAKRKNALDPKFDEYVARVQANINNITERLTRQAKITTAAGIAGAQENAKLRAGLQPDIIDAEVDKAKRIADGSKLPTDAQARASANLSPLINAHANATMSETKGAVLTPGAIEITGSSWLNPVLGGMVDPETQHYAQAARDFVSTLGYVRSGVQVRPDEVDKFLATMFAYQGDGPEQIKQKQQSRSILLGAMQAMVGRSAPEAARVLASAINAGQISPDVLSTFDIRPEIVTPMLHELQGVPIFSVDGKLIGVKR